MKVCSIIYSIAYAVCCIHAELCYRSGTLRETEIASALMCYLPRRLPCTGNEELVQVTSWNSPIRYITNPRVYRSDRCILNDTYVTLWRDVEHYTVDETQQYNQLSVQTLAYLTDTLFNGMQLLLTHTTKGRELHTTPINTFSWRLDILSAQPEFPMVSAIDTTTSAHVNVALSFDDIHVRVPSTLYEAQSTFGWLFAGGIEFTWHKEDVVRNMSVSKLRVQPWNNSYVRMPLDTATVYIAGNTTVRIGHAWQQHLPPVWLTTAHLLIMLVVLSTCVIWTRHTRPSAVLLAAEILASIYMYAFILARILWPWYGADFVTRVRRLMYPYNLQATPVTVLQYVVVCVCTIAFVLHLWHCVANRRAGFRQGNFELLATFALSLFFVVDDQIGMFVFFNAVTCLMAYILRVHHLVAVNIVHATTPIHNLYFILVSIVVLWYMAIITVIPLLVTLSDIAAHVTLAAIFIVCMYTFVGITASVFYVVYSVIPKQK